MGDGYAGDWVETLDRLKELDFEWILPGHGEATRDREIIDVFQGVLGSLWSQVAAAKQEGKTAAEAADAIDFLELLSPYPDNAFVALDPETRRAVHQRQVSRAYEVFEEGAE
jgi:glyoxylase-like metal-dependent hydrolase (beta-lactamase superfamily II)